MKKITLTIFCIFILSFNLVYAEKQECLIEGEMAPFLEEYIELTYKMLDSIEVEERNDTLYDKIKGIDIKRAIVLGYNKAYNFENAILNQKYEIELPINIEIPKQVERDLEKLKKTGEKIGSKMEEIINTGNFKGKIKNFCSAYSEVKCDISNNIAADDLLAEILSNYRKVENAYLYTVLGGAAASQDVQFVKDDFLNELEKYYGKEAYTKCNTLEGTFLTSFWEKIEETWNLNHSIEEGTQKWIDGYNLLVGKDMSEAQKKDEEAKVLKEELEKYGIEDGAQKSILDSLGKFNQEGYSKNNNFIVYTYANIWNEIEKKLVEYEKEPLVDFLKKAAIDTPEGKVIPNDIILLGKENKKKTNLINKKISTFYEKQLPFSQMSNANAGTFRSELIDTHLELLKAMETLREACPKAVKACNEQDSGAGDCGKCK